MCNYFSVKLTQIEKYINVSQIISMRQWCHVFILIAYALAFIHTLRICLESLFFFILDYSQVSVGYFFSDLGMICWLYPSLGGLEYVSIIFYMKLKVELWLLPYESVLIYEERRKKEEEDYNIIIILESPYILHPGCCEFMQWKEVNIFAEKFGIC